MKKLLLICAIIISLTANSQQITTNIGIIPTPQNIEIYDSINYYVLDKSCVIVDNKNAFNTSCWKKTKRTRKKTRKADR